MFALNYSIKLTKNFYRNPLPFLNQNPYKRFRAHFMFTIFLILYVK